jgi:hypothetical protein
MKALVPKARKNQTLKRVQGDKESANIPDSFECPACKGGVIYSGGFESGVKDVIVSRDDASID